jgi:hypothetical protein
MRRANGCLRASGLSVAPSPKFSVPRKTRLTNPALISNLARKVLLGGPC